MGTLLKYVVLTLMVASGWIFLSAFFLPGETCRSGPMSLGCIRDSFITMPPLSSMIGIYGVAIVFFALTARAQNRKAARGKDGVIRRYRHAEEYLIETGKLSHEALIEYHREYKWESYAGIALSASMVVATLVIQGGMDGLLGEPVGPNTSLTGNTLALWNAGALAISGAMMAAAELVHTNTLSPMVPIKTRLKVVGRTIVIAGMGVTLAVSSVFAFFALAAPVLAMLGTLVFFFLGMWLPSARAIPRNEMIDRFKLTDDEWDEMVKRVNDGSKRK